MQGAPIHCFGKPGLSVVASIVSIGSLVLTDSDRYSIDTMTLFVSRFGHYIIKTYYYTKGPAGHTWTLNTVDRKFFYILNVLITVVYDA
jgi:hypothetical protein